MSLFNWWKEPTPEVVEIPANTPPGTVIPVNGDPSKVIIVKTEPDMSKKPKDVVGYCFGFVCPKKHIQNLFEATTPEGFKERRACNTCGSISKPAVVKRTSEPKWGDRAKASVFDRNPKPNWGWYNSYDSCMGLYLGWGETLWNKYEFVHFLDNKKPRPRRRKK